MEYRIQKGFVSLIDEHEWQATDSIFPPVYQTLLHEQRKVAISKIQFEWFRRAAFNLSRKEGYAKRSHIKNVELCECFGLLMIFSVGYKLQKAAAR